MKRVALVGAATGLVLALGACTAAQNAREPDNWTEVNVQLQDGRTIHCLMYGNLHGGPSCDWANASRVGMP